MHSYAGLESHSQEERLMIRKKIFLAFLAMGIASFLLMVPMSNGQTGNSANINGTVLDPSNAAVVGATVEIHNPVSGFSRTTQTDSTGNFSFANVPFNPYHMSVTAKGFDTYNQDVDVRSSVAATVKVSLKVAGTSISVSVEATGGDLIEKDPEFHTDVDRSLFDKVPLESQSSSLSSLITLTTPGVAADSNGLFHGLGDHAQNSFSLDGQPITDQQSKIFSNQIPTDAIQSLEVIDGAPTAEFGGKTSLIIVATTRSGMGSTTPHGSVTGSYGTFGSATGGLDFSYGGEKWGNFISATGLNTGRFLDAPEFSVMHDKGNEENIFDRVDYVFRKKDSVHLNLQYSRSWFQNPNTFDQQFHICNAGYLCNGGGQAINPLNGNLVGPTDQRSKIETFDIAPTWTHVIGANAVFTLGAFARRDQFHFYPSGDPFADFSPDLQSQTIRQARSLFNAGGRADFSYVKGINNIKVGAVYQHTFLTENDTLGTVDPGFLGLFFALDPATGQPIPGTTCLGPAPTFTPLGDPCTTLAASDLTRPTGRPFFFHGHTDVKEPGLYAMDTISRGDWTFSLGIRGDLYNGLSRGAQAEPRAGISYNVKKTNTVLRISYARSLESPFNENLVIASTGCSNPVIAFLLPPPNIQCTTGAISPGLRNEFHAGFQQAFGKYLVVSGEYIWKYTHGGYDFGVVASSPIAFPIEWHNSKIPGWALRASVPDIHGFSALVVMSSVSARFFPPQIAAIPFLPAPAVFRIDHDEHFNLTAHAQYQPWKRGPWFGFNWRYDSGLVAGAVPCYALTATCFGSTPFVDGGGNTNIGTGQVALVNNITGLPLTADQEFQSGLTCDGKLAAPTPFGVALPSCDKAGLGSIFVKIPAPGTENDDHNPQRIQPRHLFDASVGDDNLFHNDKYRWSARFTVINLTNKVALYNFFSTFSGTHYVTPRTLTGELGFHF
jgi:hypothetical protein